MSAAASYLVAGADPAPSAGEYQVGWTHGLATATPLVALFELVATGPDVWRWKPLSEADVRFPTANNLTLSLAYTPAATGYVGSLKLVAVPFNALPISTPDSRPGGIASFASLARFRSRASAVISATFPTVIAIGDRVDIPAARWTLTRSKTNELAGLLPTPDVAIRVARAAIAGITITEGRTTLTEDDLTMRVNRIRDAKGDPGIVLECEAA